MPIPLARPRSGRPQKGTSHPLNKVNTTSTEVQVKTPRRLDKTNHDMLKVGLISARLVSALLVPHLFF